MKRKLCSVVIVLTALIAATGSANAYCYNGVGSASYYINSNPSLINAAHKAKKNWEKKARRALHTTAVYWDNASNRHVRRAVSRGKHVMVARAKFCVGPRKKPHKRGKCPKTDIKCKVNSMVYKVRPSVIPRGVKTGLNPQPEPPSKRLQVR